MTRPFRFAGEELVLNVATSAAGGVQVEMQAADGRPIPGFELDGARAPADTVFFWKAL